MIKRVSDSQLKPSERKALTFVRNRIMHTGSSPSVREVAAELGFSSPRSAVLVIDKLIELGYLKRRDDNRSLQLLRMPADAADRESTIEIPLVGGAACGTPLLAEENVEAMIPVAASLIQSGRRYFLLRANGNSMTEVGIQDGSLVLVRQQPTARDKEIVVALVDDEATIKELRRAPDAVALVPRSKNAAHRPIVLRRDFQVQGIVVATLPELFPDREHGKKTGEKGE